jgi:hypothetical protein
LRIVLVVLVLVIEKAEDEDDVSSSVVPQFDTALNNPRKTS